MDLTAGTGLVLEGGGMKGVFTAGVLDYFMEKSLYFPYIVGVSAGACQAVSYLSRQKGRNRTVNIGYIRDPRYLSYRNLLIHRSIFGMDFMFDEIPNRLVSFDYDTFNMARERLIIGTTECFSGAPVYFEKGKCDILRVLRASSSLPFVSRVVEIDGQKLLDGGVSDPIPIRKSIADGNEKNVIILTKHEGYRRGPFRARWLARLVYPGYKGLIRTMVQRPEFYNETIDLINVLQKEGKAFVIRPCREVHVKRLERNPEKLEELYRKGYQEAERIYGNLVDWLAR